MKENVTRPLLIAWGQARRFYDPNCWVDKVIEFASYLRVRETVADKENVFVVVPDWRFPNELLRVREEAAKHGDAVIALYIDRPGAPSGTPDEIVYAPQCAGITDYYVQNDGDLEAFRAKAKAIVTFVFSLIAPVDE